MRATAATKTVRDIFNSVALHTHKKDPADSQQNMNNWLRLTEPFVPMNCEIKTYK